MEADQTGFSGSTPTSVAGGTADDSNNGEAPSSTPVNRSQTYYNHCGDGITIKNEPEDDGGSPPEQHQQQMVVVSGGQGGQLPPISEENWRAAYYQHPLVVLNGGASEEAIYEAYKLPSLAKFGKGLVGKLPAIWSVAVPADQVGQPELITPHSPSSVVVAGSPPLEPPTPQTTFYLQQRPGDSKVIVQHSVDREDSVIQPVPDKESGKETMTLLAPAAVEVGEEGEGSSTSPHEVVEVEMDGRSRELQVATSPHDMQLEGAPYTVGNGEFSPNSYETLGSGQYSVLTNVVVTVAPPQYGAQQATATTQYALTPGDYYREFCVQQPTEQQQYAQAVRQHLAAYPDGGVAGDNVAYVERYIRQNYKPASHNGLTVDLPSPDSGIGETTVTPRDSLHQIFDYTEIAQPQSLLQPTDEDSSTSRSTPAPSSPSRKNSWNHEYGRNAELDKVQIPKLFSEVGFHYYLESPISTSQRREDDRMTYINKGQYYGITLEYINDPERTLRSCTVKSTVMLVFREEKSPEDELKAWKFWHSRQHSVKQRILDADTKNSCGIIGQIEEVTHNAIAFYWNPLEGPAKISVSVHCLSTDFSNQKGVKGFPLHIQVDTTDDLREGAPPIHRGYCQIKVFCDKGAERKTRDEERRAAKRKLTATGTDVGNVFTGSRKKIEEMYHPPSERSEFYSMSDLAKPPILFTPDEDPERIRTPF
ncbi:hypothetical protein JTE90_011694 [Oedothorax gibbosus]|uniref:Grh/CP2 DB domain-containing protein n=1 Tax=Oedothorax gibbosus TaxID=931172 RepID=A0AAV6USE8_9ARAC|nr:hypothetical protein JTE90_011694 [Oedothorax gibbosus]